MLPTIILFILVYYIVYKLNQGIGSTVVDVEEVKEVLLPKKTKFEPVNFSQYIGQNNTKELLLDRIKGIKERNEIFPHTLIHGHAGYGKTTLVRILANTLNIPFCEIIGSSCTYEKLMNIASRIEGGIIFIDEIHGIKVELAERLYPIMVDSIGESGSILPFTLIGATTELGTMIKDRTPFVERFDLVLELEEYSIDNLITILEQYKIYAFNADIVYPDVFRKIAENCRKSPREAIKLLKSYIYGSKSLEKVFKQHGIVYNGITVKDIKILKYLNLCQYPVGVQGLSIYLNTSQENYLYQIEPFLIIEELIARTPKGRKITNKGIELLEIL